MKPLSAHRISVNNLAAPDLFVNASSPSTFDGQEPIQELFEWRLSNAESVSLLQLVNDSPSVCGNHLREEEVTAYAHGTTSVKVLEQLDRHLASCNRCAQRVEARIANIEIQDCQSRAAVDACSNRWVEQWKAGIDPEEAFRQIFHQYYRFAFSFFVKKGFSAEESNDLAQETFLRVHKSFGTFRGEAAFQTWLFQIMSNIYRNTLRAQAIRKRDAPEVSLTDLIDGPGGNGGSESDIAQDEASGPLDNLLAQEGSHMLHAALQDLPSQMRHCVILRVERDLKYREIANIVLVSIDTVKAHLFQARQLLKVRLADYFDLKS